MRLADVCKSVQAFGEVRDQIAIHSLRPDIRCHVIEDSAHSKSSTKPKSSRCTLHHNDDREKGGDSLLIWFLLASYPEWNLQLSSHNDKQHAIHALLS